MANKFDGGVRYYTTGIAKAMAEQWAGDIRGDQNAELQEPSGGEEGQAED